ncbi:MAG: FkbM family methyltransferase, partial [Dermatophilaceae bacterium]
VFAFEPSVDACRLLAMSLQGNSITNVHVTNAALGSERGSMRLVVPEQEVTNRGGARLAGVDSTLGGELVGSTVDVEVGDDALCDTRGVQYIKIDVEGAEAEVIKGLYGTLERERPVVSVEVLNPMAKRRVEAIFGQLGFAGVALVRGRRTRRVVPLSEVADPDLSGVSLVHFMPSPFAEALIGTRVRELG